MAQFDSFNARESLKYSNFSYTLSRIVNFLSQNLSAFAGFGYAHKCLIASAAYHVGPYSQGVLTQTYEQHPDDQHYERVFLLPMRVSGNDLETARLTWPFARRCSPFVPEARHCMIWRSSTWYAARASSGPNYGRCAQRRLPSTLFRRRKNATPRHSGLQIPLVRR